MASPASIRLDDTSSDHPVAVALGQGDFPRSRAARAAGRLRRGRAGLGGAAHRPRWRRHGGADRAFSQSAWHVRWQFRACWPGHEANSPCKMGPPSMAMPAAAWLAAAMLIEAIPARHAAKGTCTRLHRIPGESNPNNFRSTALEGQFRSPPISLRSIDGDAASPYRGDPG